MSGQTAWRPAGTPTQCGWNFFPGQGCPEARGGRCVELAADSGPVPGGSPRHGHPGSFGPGLQAAFLCFQRKEFRPETRRAPITHSLACERSGSECTSGMKLSGGVKPAEGAQVWTCSGPGSRASRWAAVEPAWCNRWELGELPRAGQ